MVTSKIFFYICLSFIIGIFLASIFYIPHKMILWGLPFILPIFFFFVLKKKKILVVILLCLLAGMGGVIRYNIADSATRNNPIESYNDKKVALMGKILTEPEVRDSGIQLTIDAQKVLFNNEISFISGKFLVKVDKYPKYNYADVIVVSGLLKTPEQFSGFDYKGYLARKGIFSTISFPEIEVARQRNYSNFLQFVYGQVLDFKNNIRDNIIQRFNPLEGKLLAGIVLGDQSSFSQEFKDKLNITGLRHITAISGMNVAIICTVLMSLFLGLGLWRSQAFYLTVIFIFLFVIMIGFQASVVRAGIMGSMMLLAQRVGRVSTSIRAIGFTATVMLVLKPMLLRWDVGFQLSFLAIIGIILFTKPIEKAIKFIPQEKLINLRSILAATLSAQILTLPILIFNFGRISLVSVATNILIVPIVDWIMIFGFIFSILSSIFWGLGWIFILPCWVLLTYTLKVIEIFSLPQMALAIDNISWIWLLLFYSLIVVIHVVLKKRERLKFLEY